MLSQKSLLSCTSQTLNSASESNVPKSVEPHNANFKITSTMTTIQPCDVPLSSLLRKYKDGSGFADCYVAEAPGVVSQEVFIQAVYTSPLSKIERIVLRYLASKPATNADAKALAVGTADKFSAWRVEARSSSELLLADFTGRTRSWLMAMPVRDAAKRASQQPRTLLYFGSAVLPISNHGTQTQSMGWVFHALLGFHQLYSRLLLRAATRRVLPLKRKVT